jgi:hypothetical protein
VINFYRDPWKGLDLLTSVFSIAGLAQHIVETAALDENGWRWGEGIQQW